MKAAAHPRNDERLARLNSYGILDTGEEEVFDEIVELATRLTGSPISLVSLVDRDRQWFKARKGGLPRQTDLENSVCAHAILQDGLFEIEDLEADERTAGLSIVTEDDEAVRFYAGTPIKTSDDLPLGMLCILDTRPRRLTDDQRFALTVLGKQVCAQLELRARLSAETEAGDRMREREMELQKALSEQELLAKEIDHRVKNSLAMVSSFLNMQKRRAESEEAKTELEAASHRVAAISLLHQELYNASVTGRISLPQLADRILMLLREAAPANVELRAELEPLIVDSRRAAAFAVVTNEFVTNSFKYAFRDRPGGCVTVTGRPEHEGYRLTLSDDGVGGDPCKARTGRGLGTRIIRSIAGQLGDDARLSVTAEGYRFSALIPELKEDATQSDGPKPR